MPLTPVIPIRSAMPLASAFTRVSVRSTRSRVILTVFRMFRARQSLWEATEKGRLSTGALEGGFCLCTSTGTRRLHLPHVEVTMSEPLGSFPRARGIGWEGTRVEGGDPVSSQC